MCRVIDNHRPELVRDNEDARGVGVELLATRDSGVTGVFSTASELLCEMRDSSCKTKRDF